MSLKTIQVPRIFALPVVLLLFANTGRTLAQEEGMNHLAVTNLTLSGASISWTTDEKLSGAWVEVSSNDTVMTFNTTRGGESYVHIVELKGLTQSTDYTFVIGAGQKAWDNGGERYYFKTLDYSSEVPLPSSLIGKLIDTFGNPVTRALVRIRLDAEGMEPSLPRTAVTDENGNWIINWSEFRNSDGTLYNAWYGDRMLIEYVANYWSEAADSSVVIPSSGISIGTFEMNVYDPSAVLEGDLDSNGIINIFDLIEMLKVLSGKIVPANPQVADLDHNGKLDIFDLLAILTLLKNSAAVQS